MIQSKGRRRAQSKLSRSEVDKGRSSRGKYSPLTDVGLPVYQDSSVSRKTLELDTFFLSFFHLLEKLVHEYFGFPSFEAQPTPIMTNTTTTTQRQFYEYNPSVAAAVVYAILYTATCGFTLWQYFSKRAWFWLFLIIASISELMLVERACNLTICQWSVLGISRG